MRPFWGPEKLDRRAMITAPRRGCQLKFTAFLSRPQGFVFGSPDEPDAEN
jgi:hypothetical protein